MTDKMRLEQAQQAFDTVCAKFDNKNWHYNMDEEQMRVSFEISTQDGNIPMTLTVDPNRLQIQLRAELDSCVDQERCVDYAVALCRVNCRLADGCFDLEMPDAKIAFRMAMSFPDSTVGEETVGYMIAWAIRAVKTYRGKIKELVSQKQ